jgi:hypothetical protein
LLFPKHVEAVVQLEFRIGSISWIKLDPNPVTFAISGVILKPDWVPKTYIGLAATANDDPATSIADFNTFRLAQQFRAIAYCRVGVEVDDKTRAVTKVVPIASFTDPGYTPPFRLMKFPSAGIGSAFDGWEAFKSTWSFSYHAGELSAVSSAVIGRRHPNSTIIGVPTIETVLANMMVKFRAGAITDSLGVGSIGCPYHVPWVWCETVATYAGGKVKLYGRGSIFPTHAWYADGLQIMTQARVGDLNFPKVPLAGATAGTYGPFSGRALNPFKIIVPALALYPVLSKGAPAVGPQTALSAEAGLTGSVESHANTVVGGSLNTV